MYTIAQHQLGVINEIDAEIGILRHGHEARHKNWVPSELIPKNHRPDDLPPELIAMLVLNHLTEDGLPYFLSLIVSHLGSHGEMWKWSRRWTAEENRHATVIKYYMRTLLDEKQMAAVERQETEYLQKGFWPNWHGQPFQLLSYVTAQEMATQLSHANIARQARHHDPMLTKMLSKIAGEEGAHHQFYLRLYRKIIECNSSGAIRSMWEALRSFAMPGNNMPDFEDLAYIQQKANVFGPRELGEVVSTVIDRLSLETLSHLAPEDDKAREQICKFPMLLNRIAEREHKRGMRTIALPFLGSDVTVTT